MNTGRRHHLFRLQLASESLHRHHRQNETLSPHVASQSTRNHVGLVNTGPTSMGRPWAILSAGYGGLGKNGVYHATRAMVDR